MSALQPVMALIRQIGERYSKTPSQVALRWLIENPIVLPIPGAKNSKQAIENAGALSFSLTKDEVEALSQATLACVGRRWRQVIRTVHLSVLQSVRDSKKSVSVYDFFNSHSL